MFLTISYISFKGRFDLIPVDVNDDGCVAAKHYDQRKTPVVVAQVTTATSTILLFWTADVYHKTVSWFQKACILQGHLHAYSRPVTYEYDCEKLATRCYDLWLVRWLMLMKDRLPGQWEDKDKVEQFLGNNWNQLWSVACWKKSLKKFWAENIRLKDFGISLNSLPYCGRWRRFLQSNQWLCIAWKERGKIDRFITGESCEIFWWIA